MTPQISATFIFDDPDRKGTVTVKPSGYGLEVVVTEGETQWEFLVDLFYLSPSSDHGPRFNDSKGCVQMLTYSPTNPDGDPLNHVRVWPDGRCVSFHRPGQPSVLT